MECQGPRKYSILLWHAHLDAKTKPAQIPHDLLFAPQMDTHMHRRPPDDAQRVCVCVCARSRGAQEERVEGKKRQDEKRKVTEMREIIEIEDKKKGRLSGTAEVFVQPLGWCSRAGILWRRTVLRTCCTRYMVLIIRWKNAFCHHLASDLPCDFIPKRLTFSAPTIPHVFQTCTHGRPVQSRAITCILPFISEGNGATGTIDLKCYEDCVDWRLASAQNSIKHLLLNKHGCKDANYSPGEDLQPKTQRSETPITFSILMKLINFYEHLLFCSHFVIQGW